MKINGIDVLQIIIKGADGSVVGIIDDTRQSITAGMSMEARYAEEKTPKSAKIIRIRPEYFGESLDNGL